MAFVSGGGGGLPPQAPQPSAGSQLPGINNQLLETLLLQQQQQAANSQGNVAALLVNALLGGQLGSTAGGLGGAASLPQPQQPQQAAQNLLIQQLQNQLALSQLLGQNANLANPLLNNLTNPNLALYYQLIQQQQQTSLLQQLQQQTQQQQQTVQPAQQTPAPIPTQSLQISQPHSAFQPPQQAPSSGNVEVQAHAQEKLMADLLNSQNAQNSLAQKEIEQRMLAAGSAASTSALPDRAVPRNTKEVHDRIDKLISENAAILQPQEPLLKRRPYHRAVGQQSSMDDSNSSSTRTSPGLQAAVARDPRMLAASSRTQSLYEPINGIRAFGGGSLTSGQPVVRHQQHHTPTCPYCNVPFPNEAGLQCHELRCSKRIEMEKVKEAPAPEPPQPDSRHPLKRRLLAAAVPDEVPAIQQAKLARKDSGDVIVVAETRAQPDRKESLFEQFGHPGLPRRATIGAIPTLTPAQLPQSAPEVVIPPAPTTIQPQQMISPTQATHHPTAFHQVIQGQNRVNAAALTAAQLLQQLPLQPQQLQQRHIIPLQQVIPPQQQLPSTSALPTTPQSLPPPPSHEDSPQLSINHLFPLDGNTSKPYTLVLNEGVKTTPERTNRTRNRNITSETFVCLQRAQPMFVEQKGNLSMYSNWHQITVNEADAKLNLAFMAQCSAKPKTGQHPFWKYTVANRDMVQYKVTHSSFWEISQRLRQRQAQEGDKPVAEGDETMVKMEEKENMVSPKVEEPSPIVEMKPFAEVKAENDHKQEDEFEWTPSRSPRPNKKTDPIIGGHRTDELYVYVRGRGRGRYVCDRCGIRCKKPSMLKKHIKSHTDIRPYKCKQCNFSFKTKGNLTKHLSSKTHKRRLQAGDEYESDNEDRLEIADAEEEDKEEVCFEVPDRLDDEDESDDEEMDMFDNAEEEPFRRFGQENIILERGAHTPPSRWVLEREEETDVISWPEVKAPRRCMSAPPVAVAGPLRVDTKKTAGTPSTPPLPITAMQFVAMDTSPSTIVAQISQNGLAVPQPRLNGIISSNQPYLMNFFPKEEVLKCDQCDKSFRKQADLNYHQLTHNVEKQQLSNKNRMFQCPECRIPARTKAILSKHMEQAHGSHIDESAMAQIDPSASTQSVLGGGAAQMVNNPRSFMCLDCNIGFRKHGILAKHLRSKTHVTKLETLKRLPEDALSLIQGHDNGACLNEVDTTDCEKARASLTAIVENIRSKKHENHNSTGSTPAVTITASSLECREQLTASPMPINQRLVLDSPVNGIRSSYSETSSPFRSRCGSAASTSAIDIPRKRSDSLMHKLDPSTLQAMKFISQANVWVPPKVQDQGAHRPDSIAFRQVEPMEVDNPSSCSSPVMRILAANGNKSPPIPPGTKCSVCMTNFDTPVELQVHLYTDHISVKDGTFFRCPKKLCEKVYPNKESLRIHVAAHYRAEALDPREEDSISSGACPSIRPDELEPSTPMTDGSDSSCVSPGVQDAHRTVSAGDTPAAAFACMSCTKVFSDVHSLQHHWLSHVNRGHVCQICDAGFTTQEQLLIHQATHVNHSTNGIN